MFYFLITVRSIHLFTGYNLLYLSLFQTEFPVNYWDDLSGVASDFYYSNMQHHFTSAPIFTCHGTAGIDGIDGGHGTVQQMAGLQRLDAKPHKNSTGEEETCRKRSLIVFRNVVELFFIQFSCYLSDIGLHFDSLFVKMEFKESKNLLQNVVVLKDWRRLLNFLIL